MRTSSRSWVVAVTVVKSQARDNMCFSPLRICSLLMKFKGNTAFLKNLCYATCESCQSCSCVACKKTELLLLKVQKYQRYSMICICSAHGIKFNFKTSVTPNGMSKYSRTSCSYKFACAKGDIGFVASARANVTLVWYKPILRKQKLLYALAVICYVFFCEHCTCWKNCTWSHTCLTAWSYMDRT